MQYSTLISQIEADIYSNGMELITGDILQNVLKDMVSALAAAGACYGGAINTGSAAPADLDQATFYLATEPGEYTNYVDSNNDPLIIQGPSLIVFDGGASLVFSAVPLTNSRSVMGTSVDGDNGAIIINVGDITYGSASVIVALQGELTDAIIDHASAGLLIIKADDIAGVIECTAIGDTDQVTGVDLYSDDGDHLITVSLDSSFDYVAATVVSVTGLPVDVHTAAAPEGSLVYTGTVSPVGGAGAVRYDQAQTLSAVEQAQARVNIGAAEGMRIINSDLDTYKYLDITLISAEATIRIDMSSAYSADDVYRSCGSLLLAIDNDGIQYNTSAYYYGDDIDSLIGADGIKIYTISGVAHLLIAVNDNNDETTYIIYPLGSYGFQANLVASTSGTLKTTITPKVLQDATQVASAITAAKEVFVATYGTTTAAEIESAHNAGKTVICITTDRTYLLSNIETTYIYLSNLRQDRSYYVAVHRTNNNWSSGSMLLQRTDTRKTSWSATPSDSNYPSEKLVYDSLGKWGVISQTQTWSGTGSNPRTYTIDPASIVRGIIPQANIDLFESAGATFNAVTGYFELNGLTDISYDEISYIYYKSVGIVPIAINRSTQGVGYSARATLPMMGTSSYQTNISYWFYNALVEHINIENSSVIYVNVAGSGTTAFQGCLYLRAINGRMKLSATSSYSNIFTGCFSLETVNIISLSSNISFAQSPNLTAASVAYMISNAGTATITITLHATAYERAIADADVTAALAAHTNVSLARA